MILATIHIDIDAGGSFPALAFLEFRELDRTATDALIVVGPVSDDRTRLLVERARQELESHHAPEIEGRQIVAFTVSSAATGRDGRGGVGQLLTQVHKVLPRSRMHVVGSRDAAESTVAGIQMVARWTTITTLALLQPFLPADAFAVALPSVSGSVFVVHTGAADPSVPLHAMGRAGATAATDAFDGSRLVNVASTAPTESGATFLKLLIEMLSVTPDILDLGPLAPEIHAALRVAPSPLEASPAALDEGSAAPEEASSGVEPQQQRQQSGAPDFAPATPSVASDPVAEPIPVRVFYGTSRAPEEEGRRLSYSSERGSELSVGFAHVTIPPKHRRGHIERPSIWRLELRESPDKHVIVAGTYAVSLDEFFATMRHDLVASGHEETFVFIHGYNVRFEEAARRTAQLGYDLGIAVPTMFSWPSGGLLRDYVGDSTVADWSVPMLVEFLRELRSRSGASKIHLVAHSMGNRVLAGALVALRADAAEGPIFQQVVLTAPDIDAAVFEEQIAPQIRSCAIGTTLYASASDRALQVAHRLHRAPRAGDAGEHMVIVDGIDTIDATHVTTGLGHSVFGDVRSVVEDISLLLRLALPPTRRNLRRVQRGSRAYWEFPP